MTHKMKWTRIMTVGLIIILGCIVKITYTKINAAQTDANLLQDQLSVSTFVPEQFPVSFSNVTATKIEGQKPILNYFITNNTDDNFTNLQFVIFVVDKGGVIKAGQGWAIKKSLVARQSSEVTVSLEYAVELDDHLVLTVHKAEGNTKRFEISPSKVLENLSRKNLIKPMENFVKASSIFSPKTSATPEPCADGKKFATESCKCGIKSFECKSDGTYTFSCFTQDEGFCPKAPPDSE
ncbi:hypothetical protein BH24ACI2_BH24ACI2_01640 [soil metagenome]